MIQAVSVITKGSVLGCKVMLKRKLTGKYTLLVHLNYYEKEESEVCSVSLYEGEAIEMDCQHKTRQFF